MKLLAPPKRTEEEHVAAIVDELFLQFREYQHHHLAASVMRIVKLAQELQAWGYVMLLDPHKKMLGAAKHPAVVSAQARSQYTLSVRLAKAGLQKGVACTQTTQQ